MVDAGIDLIDTADVYGAGSSERLIAHLLADRRDEVRLATKFGIVSNDSPRCRSHASAICDGVAPRSAGHHR